MEEFLLSENPACTYRPECTPTVVLGKARSTVTAERELSEVFLIEVVTSTAEVRLCADFSLALAVSVKVLEVVHRVVAVDELTTLAE